MAKKSAARYARRMMKKNLNYKKEEPISIQEMFGTIAKDYDKTNAILSFGLNKKWNRELIHTVSKYQPKILLDLCSGTGEIAFEFMHRSEDPKSIYLLDFCQEMLQCAQEKNQKMGQTIHTLTYLQADAEKIPLLDQSVDCVTVAYGIRNVRSLENCFKEVFRVLKPHGMFGILELTKPSALLKPFHSFYLKWILPYIGGKVAKNKMAYNYLGNSIGEFIKPLEIKELLSNNGFRNVEIRPLTGGIATLLLAKKI